MPDRELSDHAGTMDPKKRHRGRECHVGPRGPTWAVTWSYQVNIETPCVNEDMIYQIFAADQARVFRGVNSTRKITAQYDGNMDQVYHSAVIQGRLQVLH